MEFLLNLLVFLVCLGILIFVHELGHFVVARMFGVRINRFSIGFGKPILRLGRDRKGTEYIISIFPLGGYVEMEGENIDECKGLPEEFMSKPAWQRILIVLAGPAINYVVGFLLFVLVYSIGAPELVPVVGDTLEGFPAEKAGISRGDRIVAVDGIKIDLWDEMAKIIHQKAGEEVSIELIRDGKRMQVRLAPKTETIKTIFGEKKQVGLIGVIPDPSAYTEVKFPLPKAIVKAWEKVWNLTSVIFKSLILLLEGNKQVREAVSGPIGIYKVTTQAWHMGISVLLSVLAVLSVSLAVFNLLPLPLLDGGHVFLFSVEALLGRALPVWVYEVTFKVGIVIIGLIMAFVFYNDIRRLVREAKQARQVVNEVVNQDASVQEDIP